VAFFEDLLLNEKQKKPSYYFVEQQTMPHAKIQPVLSTFKNGRKIQGTFLPAAFQLSMSTN